MAKLKDEIAGGWIHNPDPLLRKPATDKKPLQENPLNQCCPFCSMPVWMCECEQ